MGYPTISYARTAYHSGLYREEHVGGTHPKGAASQKSNRGTRPFWFFDFFILVDPLFCKRDPNVYPYIA